MYSSEKLKRNNTNITHFFWREEEIEIFFQYLVSQLFEYRLINTDNYEKSSKMDVFFLPRLRWEFITRHVSLIDNGAIDINSRWATHNKPGLRIEAKEKPMIIIFDKYSKKSFELLPTQKSSLICVKYLWYEKKKKKKKRRFNITRIWNLNEKWKKVKKWTENK